METILKQVVIEQMGVVIYEATEDQKGGALIREYFLDNIVERLNLNYEEEKELHKWADGYLANIEELKKQQQ